MQPVPRPDHSGFDQFTPQFWYLNVYSRFLWAAPITVLLTIFVLVAMVRGQAQDPLDNLRRSEAEYAALVGPETDNDSGADTIISAVGALSPFTGSADDHPERVLQRPSDVFDTLAMKLYFQANAQSIADIVAVANRPSIHWGGDLSEEVRCSGHSSLCRQVFSLLAARARFDAHAGRHAAAAGLIDAMNKLVQLSQRDCVYDRGWRATHFTEMADNAMKSILAYDPPATEADVDQYRKVLWRERDTTKRCVETLRILRVLLLCEMDRAMCGKSKDFFDGFLANEKFLTLFYGSERDASDTLFAKVADDMEMRGTIDLPELEKTGRNQQKGPSMMMNHLLGSTCHISTCYLNCQESAHRLQCALAVRSFQIKHRRDPASLSEIVPEFLPRLPDSVFSAGGFNLKLAIGKSTPYPGMKKFFEGKRVLRVYSFSDAQSRMGDDDDHAVLLVPIPPSALTETSP